MYSGEAGRRLRADAVANRAALITAAERVVRRQGSAVALDVVAREAGVGIATLYRNFRDRGELFDAVIDRAYEGVAELAAEAAASTDSALEVLATFLEQIIERRDHLVLPLLGAPQMDRPVNPRAGEIAADLDRVLRRGIRAGEVRRDVRAADVIVFGAMLAHAPVPGAVWEKSARRSAALFVESLRSRADVVRLPPPLSASELRGAVARRINGGGHGSAHAVVRGGLNGSANGAVNGSLHRSAAY